MKKLHKLILILLLSFTLTGCSSNKVPWSFYPDGKSNSYGLSIWSELWSGWSSVGIMEGTSDALTESASDKAGWEIYKAASSSFISKGQNMGTCANGDNCFNIPTPDSNKNSVAYSLTSFFTPQLKTLLGELVKLLNAVMPAILALSIGIVIISSGIYAYKNFFDSEMTSRRGEQGITPFTFFRKVFITIIAIVGIPTISVSGFYISLEMGQLFASKLNQTQKANTINNYAAFSMAAQYIHDEKEYNLSFSTVCVDNVYSLFNDTLSDLQPSGSSETKTHNAAVDYIVNHVNSKNSLQYIYDPSGTAINNSNSFKKAASLPKDMSSDTMSTLYKRYCKKIDDPENYSPYNDGRVNISQLNQYYLNGHASTKSNYTNSNKLDNTEILKQMKSGPDNSCKDCFYYPTGDDGLTRKNFKALTVGEFMTAIPQNSYYFESDTFPNNMFVPTATLRLHYIDSGTKNSSLNNFVTLAGAVNNFTRDTFVPFFFLLQLFILVYELITLIMMSWIYAGDYLLNDRVSSPFTSVGRKIMSVCAQEFFLIVMFNVLIATITLFGNGAVNIFGSNAFLQLIFPIALGVSSNKIFSEGRAMVKDIFENSNYQDAISNSINKAKRELEQEYQGEQASQNQSASSDGGNN